MPFTPCTLALYLLPHDDLDRVFALYCETCHGRVYPNPMLRDVETFQLDLVDLDRIVAEHQRGRRPPMPGTDESSPEAVSHPPRTL